MRRRRSRPEGLDGPCVDVGTPWVPEVLPGSRHQQVDPVLRPTFIGVDDTSVDCRTAPGACVFVVGAVGADQFVSTPLAFAATALVPSTDLLDGQAMTITATGLTPGAGFRVVHCDDAHLPVAWTCEDPLTHLGRGRRQGTLRPRQRHPAFTTVLERAAYCRDECAVLLLPDDESLADVRLRYELAGGEITAAPATGVIDGQEVTLSGSGLMDSYDGPAVGFLTSGVWGLGQCGRGVLDDPTVRGVFAHCTGAGPIELAGAPSDAAVPVRSTSIPYWPPVDCTARQTPGVRSSHGSSRTEPHLSLDGDRASPPVCRLRHGRVSLLRGSWPWTVRAQITRTSTMTTVATQRVDGVTGSSPQAGPARSRRRCGRGRCR